MKKKKILSLLAASLICAFWVSLSPAARIKDIAHIDGVRENQLYGYGLVIGLNSTGDRQGSSYTLQGVGNMLRRFNVNVPPAQVATQIRSRNIAAVIVTANLPAFVKSGTHIDVTISSIGDATSLAGGVLLQTPLVAADGNVYAVAQGQVSLGLATGTRSVAQGPLNVARIASGALIEKEVPSTVVRNGGLSILLNSPDFSTADRIIQAVNKAMNTAVASATDAGTIRVEIPEDYRSNVVGFIARLETLSVTPDAVAKVIINERTGTIVAGKDVRISTVALTQGNISVQIQSKHELTESTVQAKSYPPKGQLVSNTDSVTTDGEGIQKVVVLEEGVDINELVKALNSLGVTPKDLISILQAMKAAGALQAEIEII